MLSPSSMPMSRIAEPQFSTRPAPDQQNAINKSPVMASPNSNPKNTTPNSSALITPRAPSLGGDDDDDDDDESVYKTEDLTMFQANKGKKAKFMVVIEWVMFVSMMAVLILSRVVDRLKDTSVWSLDLWKWCVLVLVIFCGRLFTEWLINSLVFSIKRIFLLNKKVLYVLFGLEKSLRSVIWLALILLAWVLLIHHGFRRKGETSRVSKYITRAIVSALVGAVLWTAKTLLVKTIASSFHVRAYFDRIQESIFHQYILQALSKLVPAVENDGSRHGGTLSFSRGANLGKKETNREEINVDKLCKMRREKVSAWTMNGLIRVVKNSELQTMSQALDGTVEDDFGARKVITSEVEAQEAADRIFKNVAKPHNSYIEEDDLLLFMPKEDVNKAFLLFEGAAESRQIKRSSFIVWVVKAYKERKCLGVALTDAKTATEELNKIASVTTVVVIIIVWLLLMEITTSTVLVLVSSQLLLVVFVFGNTLKSAFEALIFVFIVHPFDVGDLCAIDGVQMTVDEMNIFTTAFLKADKEKVYYPNSVLATKPISNFNRNREMTGDSSIDINTSVESIDASKAIIKGIPVTRLNVLETYGHGKISALAYRTNTSPEIVGE